MLKLVKLAITGGMASGKSTVLSILKDFGAYVVDADKIVHLLLEKDSDTMNALIKELGEEIVVENKLNRALIASKVFNQPNPLKNIEKILHPKVFQEIQKQYAWACQQSGYSLFAVEMPLLFETQSEPWYDITLAVVADPKLCAQRCAEKFNEQEYQLRMARQLSQEEKAGRATFVIYNNHDKDHLKKDLQTIFQF